MNVEYNNTFIKHYRKRISFDPSLVSQFDERVLLFSKDMQNPILKDHVLRGKKAKMRAFSITGDIRIIYQLIGNTAYFLDIGSHNQVY
jgi:mRNA-degrading endonuclease YafQ of YafQ-DinJ toxin-antitoxin module